MNLKKQKKIIGNLMFTTNTPLSKTFDIILLILIVLSIVLVMLESVESTLCSMENNFLLENG